MSVPSFQKTSVIGAGAWGTALALAASDNGAQVTLWTHLEEEARHIRETRKGLRPVEGARPLPEHVLVSNDWADVEGSDLLIVVVPSTVMRPVAESLAQLNLADNAVLLSCTKGIEQDTNLLMTQILQDKLPNLAVGVLSGPNHAEDIVLQLPSLSLVGFEDMQISAAVQHRLSTPFLRIYTSNDVAGIQLGGAIKNVFAVASGICAGLGLGDNARAALATRGLAEMTRLGIAAGGSMETFMGLSGMGDLVVTCYSDHSRNLRAGRLLARGYSMQQCMNEICQVVEGIPNTLSAWQLARKLNVRTPLIDAMYAILYEGRSAQEVLHELMNRSLREENVTL